MNISNITITNFQSHHNTVIEPAPAGQLTVIVGPSDTGKSAIIRALRWLYYNEPQGADFITVGKKQCSVAIASGEPDDANAVRVMRIRDTGKGNQYNINGQTFGGFGVTVPQEVQDITGVRPVIIGDKAENLNLAEQLDGPFLGKSISAPARAKALGKLIGTERVDTASKKIGTDLYRREQDKKRVSGEIIRLKEEIAKYDYLDALKGKIDQLTILVAKIKEDQERLKQIRKTWEDLCDVSHDYNAAGCELEQSKYLIGELGKIIRELDYGIPTISILLDLINQYIDTKSKFEYYQNDAAELADYVNAAEKNVSELTLAIPRLENLSVLSSQYIEAAIEKNKQEDTLNSVTPFAEKAGQYIQEADEKAAASLILENLHNNIIDVWTRMAGPKEIIQVAAFTRAIDADVIWESILRLIKLSEERDTYKRVKVLQSGQLEEIEEAKEEIKTSTLQYEEFLTGLGMCPYCGAISEKFNLEVI